MCDVISSVCIKYQNQLSISIINLLLFDIVTRIKKNILLIEKIVVFFLRGFKYSSIYCKNENSENEICVLFNMKKFYKLTIHCLL